MVAPLLFAATLGVQITTSQIDNARTNANVHETVLTPSNVNPRQFGKVFSLRVDGDVYAQPLYLPDTDIPGRGRHNVLFVATEHDSVYAFDADGPATAPLWQVNFVKQDPGSSTVPGDDLLCPFIQPEVGITPTPVIDYPTGTLYVLARTKKDGRYYQRLHALAITTGVEKFGGPAQIEAEGFGQFRALPRAGLALSKGQVVMTWASSCDNGPYHGWVMTYDAHTLKQTGVFNTSPGAGQSGIWQADMAPAVDDAGNIYAATGNGKFNLAGSARDYGDTLLKLGFDGGKLAVGDFFTPPDQVALNSRDADFGSGAPILLPDQPGPHPHLLLVGGKDGTLYLLDRDHLGGYRSGVEPVQTIHLGKGFYSAPAYWNGQVYALASEDYLRHFPLIDGRLTDHLTCCGTQRFGNPGATPAVSADGDRNGIVWVVETKAWNDWGSNRPAVLHAYDAFSVGRELFSGAGGPAVRFTVPTIANGKVYVGTKGEVDVYGILNSAGSKKGR